VIPQETDRKETCDATLSHFATGGTFAGSKVSWEGQIDKRAAHLA
jgi:hypothetical protein